MQVLPFGTQEVQNPRGKLSGSRAEIGIIVVLATDRLGLARSDVMKRIKPCIHGCRSDGRFRHATRRR